MNIYQSVLILRFLVNFLLINVSGSSIIVHRKSVAWDDWHLSYEDAPTGSIFQLVPVTGAKRVVLNFKKHTTRAHKINIFNKDCTILYASETSYGSFIDNISSSIPVIDGDFEQFSINVDFIADIYNTPFLQMDLSGEEIDFAFCIRVDLVPDGDGDSVNFLEITYDAKFNMIAALEAEIDLKGQATIEFDVGDFEIENLLPGEAQFNGEITTEGSTRISFIVSGKDSSSPIEACQLETKIMTGDCQNTLPYVIVAYNEETESNQIKVTGFFMNKNPIDDNINENPSPWEWANPANYSVGGTMSLCPKVTRLAHVGCASSNQIRRASESHHSIFTTETLKDKHYSARLLSITCFDDSNGEEHLVGKVATLSALYSSFDLTTYTITRDKESPIKTEITKLRPCSQFAFFEEPNIFSTTACVCNTDNICDSSIYNQGQVLDVCLFIIDGDNTFHFDNIESFLLTQDDIIKQVSVAGGSSNSLTVVQIDGAFAKISTVLSATFFMTENPSLVFANGSFNAKFASNTRQLAESSSRVLQVSQDLSKKEFVVPIEVGIGVDNNVGTQFYTSSSGFPSLSSGFPSLSISAAVIIFEIVSLCFNLI